MRGWRCSQNTTKGCGTDMIRPVRWNCFGVHSMPVHKFVVDVMDGWDAIAYSHWENVRVAFGGETRTVKEFASKEHSIFRLLNEHEKNLVKGMYEKRIRERGCA